MNCKFNHEKIEYMAMLLMRQKNTRTPCMIRLGCVSNSCRLSAFINGMWKCYENPMYLEIFFLNYFMKVLLSIIKSCPSMAASDTFTSNPICKHKHQNSRWLWEACTHSHLPWRLKLCRENLSFDFENGQPSSSSSTVVIIRSTKWRHLVCKFR